MKKTISIVVLTLSVYFLISYMIKSNLAIKNKPNIILITLDALRADHVGCYGYPKNTTPFIDELSKKSLIFKNCIAQSGSTVQALSALLTSKFVYLDAVVGEQFVLGKRYVTLAEFLRSKGYFTIAIVGHYYVKRKFGFDRGFDYYDDNFKSIRNACEFLEAIKKAFESRIIKKKIFFMWMHMREPRPPFELGGYKYINEFYTPFVGDMQSKVYEMYNKKIEMSNKGIHELIARYDSNIKFVDENLKAIFQFFSTKNLLKNSIIIITSDHGESLGEHDIFNHNHLYYGILRVPLIIKISGMKSRVINSPVSSIDIFPTILDILGYDSYVSRLKLRGRSLLGKRNSKDIQFSEYSNSYSLIQSDWRLFIDELNNAMLFNIKTDPQESHNLIDAHKDRYSSLFSELQNVLKSKTKDSTTEINRKEILNSEDVEVLKSLGYLN